MTSPEPPAATRSARLNAALFVGLLAVIAGLAAWLEHRAPVTLDGWRHYFKWQQPDYGFAEWLVYYKRTWFGGNPRLGQWLTHAVYAPGPAGEVTIAAIAVSFHLLVPALVLGRWPDPRRGEDLFLLVVTSALFWMGVPQPGVSLFYRPVATNYTFGALATLGLFVPLRFWIARGCPESRAWPLAVVGALCGFVVGLCNEHSGPTAIVAFAVVGVIAAFGRRRRIPPWMVATWLGLIIGFLALYFAPGQSKRYSGLAMEQGLLGRVLDRGWPGNPLLIVKYLKGEGWLFLLATLCSWSMLTRRDAVDPKVRGRLVEAAWWTLGGLSIVLVTLVSPKIGSRMWIAGALPMIVATAIFVQLAATSRRSRAVLAAAALTVTVSGWGYATYAYTILGDQFDKRIERLEAAEPGSTLDFRGYAIGKGMTFFGDGFAQPRVREVVTKGYGLKKIRHRPPKKKKKKKN